MAEKGTFGNPEVVEVETDLLIIGGGMAACGAAVEAKRWAPKDMKITLVDKAARPGMPAVSRTDHGSLAGAIDLYPGAGEQGVKPIIGCEVYVADDRHKQTKGTAPLTLLDETKDG